MPLDLTCHMNKLLNPNNTIECIHRQSSGFKKLLLDSGDEFKPVITLLDSILTDRDADYQRLLNQVNELLRLRAITKWLRAAEEGDTLHVIQQLYCGQKSCEFRLKPEDILYSHDENGSTALMLAASNGDTNVVQAISMKSPNYHLAVLSELHRYSNIKGMESEVAKFITFLDESGRSEYFKPILDELKTLKTSSISPIVNTIVKNRLKKYDNGCTREMLR